MQYEIRPQKHSERFPYDNGWALWDTKTNVQRGWSLDKAKALESAAERNANPPTWRDELQPVEAQ